MDSDGLIQQFFQLRYLPELFHTTITHCESTTHFCYVPLFIHNNILTSQLLLTLYKKNLHMLLEDIFASN